MNCECCSESFNHSIRIPYELVQCSHNLCLVCIQQKTDASQKCPLCTVPIKLKKLNINLNEIEQQSYMQIDDSVAYIDMELGLNLLKKQKYEKAIVHFDKVIVNEPNNLLACKNKAKALYRLYNHQDAIECFDKFIKRNQNSAKAHFEKGKYLSDRMISHKEAIVCFDKAIELILKSKLELKLKQQVNDLLVIFTLKGISLRYLRNRNEEAINCLDAVIEIAPNSLLAYYNKGKALQQSFNLNEALVCFEKSIKINPNYSKSYLNKGRILKSLKSIDRAIKYFEKSIGLNPYDIMAYYEKAKTLRELKKFDESIECYDKAICFNPNILGVHQAKIDHLCSLDRYEQVIPFYEKCIEMNLNNPDAYFNKADYLVELDMVEEAIPCFDKVIELSLNNSNNHVSTAYYYKAIYSMDFTRYQEAIEFLDTAIKLSPYDEHYKYVRSDCMEALSKKTINK